MLEQLREQIAKLQAPDREREKLIQRQLPLATEQITWYALVQEGKAEMLESIRERQTAWQRRIDQMTSELQEISRRRRLPLSGRRHDEGVQRGHGWSHLRLAPGQARSGGAQARIELAPPAGIEPASET